MTNKTEPMTSVNFSGTISPRQQIKKTARSQAARGIDMCPVIAAAKAATPMMQVIDTQSVSPSGPMNSMAGLYTNAKGIRNPAKES